jgi:hypothetical protein
LRLAGKDNALFSREAAQPLGHHIVLALAFAKQHQRKLVLPDETIQSRDKSAAHRAHQHR